MNVSQARSAVVAPLRANPAQSAQSDAAAPKGTKAAATGVQAFAFDMRPRPEIFVTSATMRTDGAPPAVIGLAAARADSSLRGAVRPAVGGLAKRAFDILVSAALLIAFSPLMALTALLVWLDSPGPVLFAQRRGGLHGVAFNILKFRTMKVAEDGPEVRQAVKGDARITRVGAFLRRSSIDELPQLLNVLRGDMSLVGPRPHALAHDEQFARLAPGYEERFTARPGITGLAQVSGARGETQTKADVERRLSYDLHYVRNWTLLSDILILIRTALVIFRDPRAY